MDALITVSGNLGTEVEYRAGDGWSIASFRLACTPRLRRNNTWVDGNTTWLSIEGYNRLADNLRDSLAKGDPVVVTGRLRTKVWQTEQTRNERVVIEATAIGHDLARGTTQFTKNPPRAIPEPEDAEITDEVSEVEPVPLGVG